VLTGDWRVDPARSQASFTARVAGRPVRGRLPLTGGVLITQPIEDSAAHLVARAGAVSTGSIVLDRLLTGPGFLDAGVFPEISFRSEQLACVPAGWRAIGQLQVKGTEHALACQLEVVQASGRDRRPGAPLRLTIASRWVLDSRWVTSQWVPALSRHIAMTCSAALEPAM
jgi:polyisoprenoid-binding protein YceI